MNGQCGEVIDVAVAEDVGHSVDGGAGLEEVALELEDGILQAIAAEVLWER